MTTKSQTPEQKKEDLNQNIQTILFYSLSVVVALGINDLATTIFSSFSYKKHIFAKIMYILTLFGLTVLLAYYMNSKVII